MANDLAGLNSLLDTQLRDGTDATWSSGEKDQLLNQAVAELALFGIFTVLNPASYTQTITKGTYTYTLNNAIRILSRVDLLDSGNNEIGPLHDGTWETAGSVIDGSGIIHVSPTIIDSYDAGKLRYVAYGIYNTTTDLIPDRLVSAVLAHARAEAYRRIGTSRMRFKQLQKAGGMTDVTVGDLYQLISEAEREKDLVFRHSKTWTRPKPARV